MVSVPPARGQQKCAQSALGVAGVPDSGAGSSVVQVILSGSLGHSLQALAVRYGVASIPLGDAAGEAAEDLW